MGGSDGGPFSNTNFWWEGPDVYGGEDGRRSQEGDVWVLDSSAGSPVGNVSTCIGLYQRKASKGHNQHDRKFWTKSKGHNQHDRKKSTGIFNAQNSPRRHGLFEASIIFTSMYEVLPSD